MTGSAGFNHIIAASFPREEQKSLGSLGRRPATTFASSIVIYSWCMATRFVTGLKLSRLFYDTTVKQILASEFPQLRYSAALIGRGSEVLGFDTARSTDHNWGPRLQIFLKSRDYNRYSNRVSRTLSRKLPRVFMGYSTHFSRPDEGRTRLLEDREAGPINHLVELYTTAVFFREHLGFDPTRGLSTSDWLSSPAQQLLALTSGCVFYDGLHESNKIRDTLAYYPRDVWLYMLASQWRKIWQEEPFVGRTGDVGDDLGSRIIAARLVNHIMTLCFLMARTYPPYSKWFGLAFSRLSCARPLTPLLRKVLKAQSWKQRERALAKAYVALARLHNNLRITEPLNTGVSGFHDRPYVVLHADRFENALYARIRNKTLQVARRIGSKDQFTDSTDVVDSADLSRKVSSLFEG
jgi:hypothetical protein